MSEEDLSLTPKADSLPVPPSFHKTKIQKANEKWLAKKKRKYQPGYKQRNLDWLPTYKKERLSKTDNDHEEK